MGTFWASSRALAHAASLVLAAGLLSACDLNPQPTPPEKLRGSDEPGSTSSAASTAGGITVPQLTNSTATGTSSATTGSPIVDGEDDVDGDGVIDSGEMPSPSGGGGLEGGFGSGGAAGAAGAGTDEPLPPPTNAPH